MMTESQVQSGVGSSKDLWEAIETFYLFIFFFWWQTANPQSYEYGHALPTAVFPSPEMAVNEGFCMIVSASTELAECDSGTVLV